MVVIWVTVIVLWCGMIYETETKALSFDAAANEGVTFAAQLPHGWELGSGVIAHVHWSPSTTDTGDVKWVLYYSKQAVNGGAFPAEDSLVVTTAGSGTAKSHQYITLGTINMSAITTISPMLMCSLKRIGAAGTDTFTGEAYLLEIDFHYQIDSRGSRWENVK